MILWKKWNIKVRRLNHDIRNREKWTVPIESVTDIRENFHLHWELSIEKFLIEFSFSLWPCTGRVFLKSLTEMPIDYILRFIQLTIFCVAREPNQRNMYFSLEMSISHFWIMRWNPSCIGRLKCHWCWPSHLLPSTQLWSTTSLSTQV